jgi:UDP-N-acetylmuramoylalanine--D-glutamate ligase
MKLIIGYGKTGRSAVQFFEKTAQPYRCVLNEENSINTDDLQYLDKVLPLSSIEPAYFEGCHECLISPGLDPHVIRKQLGEKDLSRCVNDIELFYRHAKAPIIAVTGTNGKSTVVTWITSLLEAAGVSVLLGGNIGIPALDLLFQPVPDYYVLELSSYQIELFQDFQCEVAVLLNMTPDHLERHGSMEEYTRVKRSLLARAKNTVVEGEQEDSVKGSAVGEYQLSTVTNEFSLLCDNQKVLSTKDMQLKMKQNALNALFVLAVSDTLNVDRTAAVMALSSFSGLPHRCEVVPSCDGVLWINDSKATNVAATVAAVNGFLACPNIKLTLILGGQPKSKDYSALVGILDQKSVNIAVFGDAVQVVLNSFSASVSVYTSLDKIVADLRERSEEGDVILFSPGGASFDRYLGFEKRGEHFKSLVRECQDAP